MKSELRFLQLLTPAVLLFSAACSNGGAKQGATLPSFLVEEADGLYLDTSQVAFFVDEDGNPVSTAIIEDKTLGTVHTFDILPVIVTAPVRGGDGLWRLDAWISSGRSLEENGYLVTIVLGYDDTVIEYDLLPGYLFEFKSGNTDTIGNVLSDLEIGAQIFTHVIGEHSFTAEDMAAIAGLGFDYPQIVEGHEEENLTILEALVAGRQPPAGEIRGVGLIYRGVANQ